MSKFFFHLRDGVVALDREGTELPDFEAVQIEAATLAGQMLRDHPRDFWKHPDWHVEVTDEAGLIVFTLYVLAVASPSAQTRLSAAAGRSRPDGDAVPP